MIITSKEEPARDFRLSVVENLKSIERFISDDDLVAFTFHAGLIESDVDYLLSRLSHSENERFNDK